MGQALSRHSVAWGGFEHWPVVWELDRAPVAVQAISATGHSGLLPSLAQKQGSVLIDDSVGDKCNALT